MKKAGCNRSIHPSDLCERPPFPSAPPFAVPSCSFAYPPPPYHPTSPIYSECTVPKSSSPSPPPLPPRSPVIIGRHVAKFNLKTPPLKQRNRFDAQQIYSRSVEKKFINPIVSSRRECTDVICCILFCAFVLGWGFVAVFAFVWGKPERLIHPTDSEGRTCGQLKHGYYNLRSKPYLFYFDITKCVSYSVVFAGCQTPQICVEKCPTSAFTYLQMQTVPTGAQFQHEVSKNLFCVDGVNVDQISNFATLKSYVDRAECAAYTVPSAAVLGRCVPQVLLNLGKTVEQAQGANSSLNSLVSSLGNGNGKIPNEQQLTNSSNVIGAVVNQKSVVEKIAADLSVTWWQILSMLFVTAVVAFLWTVVMRFLGAFLVSITVLFVVAVLAFGAGYCWYRYKMLNDVGAINDFSFQPNISLYFEMPTTWMVIAIFLSVVLLIVLVILLFVRSRITLAVALIKESSKAVGAIMSALLFPIFPFIMHLLVFILWALIAIWLATSGVENCRRPLTTGGDPSNGTPCDCSILGTGADSQCQYINLTQPNDKIGYMQAYNLFAFFWLTCFISGLADVTLAGAFASYYWAFNKPKDVPSIPILRSLGRALKYHLGTVAFGSLILALVKFIRVLLDYLEKKLSAAQNKVAKFILLCLKCCFWCLEAFLKFLTRNAFIMTAIYGKNFCTAAKDSFMLIMENIVRYTVLDRVTDFLLFLGKVTITLAMGVVAFYWFSGRWVIDGLPHIDLYYHFVPIIVIVIGAYFIADCFFDVYEMAVDTTFLCFLEDAKSNDGTPDRPYYMSKDLQRILGKQNQFKTADS